MTDLITPNTESKTTVTASMPWMLSLITTVALLIVIVLFMYHELPDKSHDIVLILVTALTTGWLTAINYYFGTSAGSEAKNKTIEKLSE